MLFQMRFRTLFRAFLLLTAQVGSNFVIISTNSWDCYKFGITVTIASPKGIQKCFFDFNVFTLNIVHPRTFVWGCVSAWFGRALAWHARGQRFDPAILHQKSTVLRRKYGAFLFAEASFLGLHCFACTVFRLFAGGSDTPPTFDVTPFSKKNVCRLVHRIYSICRSFVFMPIFS